MASLNDTLDQFRSAMAAAGVPCESEIKHDTGKPERFRVATDQRGTINGWYVLYTDGVPAGAFGCWKRGITVNWCGKPDTDLTPVDRAHIAKRMAEAEEARKLEAERRHAAAAERAAIIWDAATPCDAHPYLTRKGVQSHGLRVGRWTQYDEETGEIWLDVPDALLIPVMDGKRMAGLQAVFPEKQPQLGNRDKTFLAGTKKRGCFFRIGAPANDDPEPTIYVCEGYATGASIHAATGAPVVISFDAGNLAPVSDRVRRSKPNANIVIAADNDRWTMQPVENPGLHYAKLAASSAGARIVLPEFDDLDSKPTDFNDLHMMAGLDAVASQLAPPPAIITPQAVATTTANDNDPVMAMFTQWAFVAARKKFIHIPTSRLVDVDAFNMAHIHLMDQIPDAKKARPADYVRRVIKNRVVHDIMYLPTMWNGDPFVSMDGIDYLNAYNDNSVPTPDPDWREHSAWEICLNHIQNILPNDWQHVLHWMAHNVQRPGCKILWSPVIVGMPGDGKTTIAKMLTAAMGRKHTQVVGPEALNSDFNGWAEGRCVTTFEEIRAKGHSRHDFMNKLKPLITNDVVDIVAKGANSRNVLNCTNYLALSNFRDALVLDADDRRWGVFFTRFESRAQVLREMDSPYWAQLNDFAIRDHPEVIRAWLLSVPLDGFNPNEGPVMNAAKRYMIENSLSSDAQSIAEIVGAGAYGVNHSVVETKRLNDALRSTDGRPMQTSRMSAALRELGFTKADKTVKWDGRACWVWTRPPFVYDDTSGCRDRIREALSEHRPPPTWEHNF